MYSTGYNEKIRQLTQDAGIGEDGCIDVSLLAQFANSNFGSEIYKFLRRTNEERALGLETGKVDLVTRVGIKDGFYKKFRGDEGAWGGGDKALGQVELVGRFERKLLKGYVHGIRNYKNLTVINK